MHNFAGMQCSQAAQQLVLESRSMNSIPSELSYNNASLSAAPAACKLPVDACFQPVTQLHTLLQVFDIWKVAAEDVIRDARQQDAPLKLPRLSAVSLAFLEACCRDDGDFSWRVYDVCAVMRQQKEQRDQAALAHPPKLSHHFKQLD